MSVTMIENDHVTRYTNATCCHGIHLDDNVTFSGRAPGSCVCGLRWIARLPFSRQGCYSCSSESHRMYFYCHVPFWRRWLWRVVLGVRWERIEARP